MPLRYRTHRRRRTVRAGGAVPARPEGAAGVGSGSLFVDRIGVLTGPVSPMPQVIMPGMPTRRRVATRGKTREMKCTKPGAGRDAGKACSIAAGTQRISTATGTSNRLLRRWPGWFR